MAWDRATINRLYFGFINFRSTIERLSIDFDVKTSNYQSTLPRFSAEDRGFLYRLGPTWRASGCLSLAWPCLGCRGWYISARIYTGEAPNNVGTRQTLEIWLWCARNLNARKCLFVLRCGLKRKFGRYTRNDKNKPNVAELVTLGEIYDLRREDLL